MNGILQMHEMNKLRLQAGLPIDAKYEITTSAPVPPAVVPANNNVELYEAEIVAYKNQIKGLEKLIDCIFESFSSVLTEVKLFRKNQDVEDIKSSKCYKVIKPVGHDDSEDVVYDVVCPETGETAKKSASQLRAKQKNEKPDEKEPAKVKESIDVLNVDNNEKQDKTPAIVIPQPQKTKVPSFVKKDLADAITMYKNESKKLKMHDEANAMFQEQVADALERLADLMVDDIKQAQIFLSSLMGPILHKVPSSVCKFIYSGGDTSLKSYFNK